MPEGDMPFIMMKLEMPKGTALSETNKMVKQIEDVLGNIEGVDNYMTLLGTTDDEGMSGNQGMPGSTAEAVIWTKLKSKSERSLSQSK